MAPEKMPPDPRPAMARPTIRALLVGAVPQTRELNLLVVDIGLGEEGLPELK